jgi:pimeloyl-ACP methyl ester carboxylesterase
MKLAQQIVLHYFRARLNGLAVFSKRKAAQKAYQLFCTPYRHARRKKPRIFQKGEPLSFPLQGIRIKGFRFNHPSPQKVLILHGFESTCLKFDRYIQPLIRKGYEVLAFDAPAHGMSEGRQITLPLYISMLKKIQELYGPIDRYMAHSFGGLALTLFLEQQPSVPSTRMVLIAPATETVTAIDSFFRLLHLDEKIRKAFDELILQKSGFPASHFSIARALPGVAATVLWIHDEDDELTPLSDALRIKEKQLPHLQFSITKGLGHRKIYRDNQVAKQIIDFL